MADELQGKTITILAADGVEQVELEQPRKAVSDAGDNLRVDADAIAFLQAFFGPASRSA